MLLMLDGLFEILDAEFRWVLVVSVFITFSISKYYRGKARKARRQDRQILRSEESVGLILTRIFVAIPLFAGVFAYMLSPSWMSWSHLDLPIWLHSAGSILVILSIPMGYWVMSSLGDNVSETIMTRPGQQLITNGPYRWIRHPLYTNGMMLFLGAGLGAESWFILSFTVLTWALIYRTVIPKEEAELIRRFGPVYEEYMRTTGRLLPQIRQAGPDAV